MAIVNINKKTFEKEIGKFDEKMQDRIAMFGTPIEEIGVDEFQIEVFPNRPDLLSYQGFKRAFLGYLSKYTGLKKYKVNVPEKNYQVIVDSSVKNVRPYTACAIVKDLKFDDERIKEIIEVQEKLHLTLGRKRKKVAIGIYPMEKITLPIKFIAKEPDQIRFVPLETTREMSGLEILQRNPTGKEYAHLLAGKQKFPIFIDSDSNILSMPPIINSQLTGKITEETKDVFIECSGGDFEILKKCLNMLVTCMADMGGKIYQMELKYGGKKELTPDLTPDKMKVSIGRTNKLLGLNLNEKQVKGFLERMGYSYKNKNVEIPAWRTDVLHEVDLMEDVAIAYGYDRFVPEIPEISTIGREDFKEVIKRKICEILSGLGMLEVSNLHLTRKDDQFRKMDVNIKNEKDFIEVEESKTDYSILRKDLTHYLLKVISENSDSEYPQKIFEIGRVFRDAGTEIIEEENFCCGFTPGNFTEMKQVLEYVFRMIDLEIEIKESEKFPKHFIDGRVAEIVFNGKVIGYIGEIHPKILRNWKIKMPVALFEIKLESVFEKIAR